MKSTELTSEALSGVQGIADVVGTVGKKTTLPNTGSLIFNE